MKKRYILLLLLLLLTFLVSIGLNFYFFGNFNIKAINKDIKPTEQLRNNIDFTKQDLEKECNNVIMGRKSLVLEKTDLFMDYKMTLNELEKGKKEYLDFLNLYNKNCKYFKGTENLEVCNIIKNNNINKVNGKKDYLSILIKGFIEKKNYCYLISNKKQQKDCNLSIKDYLNIKNDKINNILGSSYRTLGKAYIILGKEKYIKKVNKEFLKKCIKL